jgi:hypothetical protein
MSSDKRRKKHFLKFATGIALKPITNTCFDYERWLTKDFVICSLGLELRVPTFADGPSHQRPSR